MFTLIITLLLGTFAALIPAAWLAHRVHPLAGIIGWIAVFLMISGPTVIRWLRWRRLPTLADYKSQNPTANTKRGIQCIHCGGNRIRNWGVWNAKDAKRSHICETCNSALYRSYGKR